MTTGFVQNHPKTVAPLAAPNLSSFILTLGSLGIKSKDRLLLCALFMSVGQKKGILMDTTAVSFLYQVQSPPLALSVGPSQLTLHSTAMAPST